MSSRVVDTKTKCGSPAFALFARVALFAAFIAATQGLLYGQTPTPQEQGPTTTTTTGTPQVQDANQVGTINGSYQLGPSDVIRIRVLKQDLLSQDGLRIGNDGNISLSMIDEPVHAACLTEAELSKVITELYRKYMVNPQVQVSTRQFNSNTIAVIGAVNAPGRFQLQRPYRLVELLSLVNGPSQNVGRTAEILRYGNQPSCDGKRLVFPSEPRQEIISIVLAEAFRGGESANPVIMPGDIVRISSADVTNAYIQGNVKNPMAVPLKEPVSLVQAVAMAGGTISGAQLDKVRIRRPIPGSVNRTDLMVNLKEINQGKQDDVLLEPNDIVEIPGPTGVKKIFSDLYKTVVPTLTSLPMRVVYF